ncbi:MAG: 3-oxoacyl-[acyl-carrier-protein] synthase-3 [Enterobacterales bacterium]|jgi:3-oxoacyl-[acyl-carrier-protein] synthase-3
MTKAVITGWGKCLPPTVIHNDDFKDLFETSDEWITSRTGIKERRISHVKTSDLAHIAAERALAAAGVEALEVDLIILATCTADTLVPNAVSRVQTKLGAFNAAALDINTACSGFLYGLTLARAQIESGLAKKILVIGAEKITTYLNWKYRSTAILFGDGAGAVLLEPTEEDVGILATSIGNDCRSADFLKVPNFGSDMDRFQEGAGALTLVLKGQDIFKRAVAGMSHASKEVLGLSGLNKEQLDLIIPHQANLRIIDAVIKRLDVDSEKTFVNIQKYGNTSSASIPIALTEALEEGRLKSGSHLLLTAFGAGLSVAAVAIRWGSRVTPLSTSDKELEPCDKSFKELIAKSLAYYNKYATEEPSSE